MKAWVYGAGAGVVAAGVTAFVAMHHWSSDAALEQQWDMLNRYCMDCHNKADFTADLSFEGRRPDNVPKDPGTWE